MASTALIQEQFDKNSSKNEVLHQLIEQYYSIFSEVKLRISPQFRQKLRIGTASFLKIKDSRMGLLFEIVFEFSQYKSSSATNKKV